MATAIGARGRYVATAGADGAPGLIRAEVCRWTVDGPHKLHEFRYVQEARVLGWGIGVDSFVEHWVGGARGDRFGWGHGPAEAYASSQKWERRGGSWYVDLVSAHVFRHDLPCCGGPFAAVREFVGYATLTVGGCAGCGKRWEIGDGHWFMPVA